MIINIPVPFSTEKHLWYFTLRKDLSEIYQHGLRSIQQYTMAIYTIWISLGMYAFHSNTMSWHCNVCVFCSNEIQRNLTYRWSFCLFCCWYFRQRRSKQWGSIIDSGDEISVNYLLHWVSNTPCLYPCDQNVAYAFLFLAHQFSIVLSFIFLFIDLGTETHCI